MTTHLAQERIDRPLTLKKMFLAAREFRGKTIWVVDNSNCISAALALRFGRPSELYLIARNDAEEDLPIEVVEEMSGIAEDCKISLRFVDSFLKPGNAGTDHERLKCIMENERFAIHRFYGYPAKEDIMKLQNNADSIITLGLAIKSQTDSATIGSLDGWNKLEKLNVSVRIDMDVNDLMGLNPSFSNKDIFLTFPYLTDEEVDNVRPFIGALMCHLPMDKQISGLYFPRSRLTAAGAWRLALRLKSLGAKEVCIEPCGNWKPDQKEKNDINDMFKDTGSVTEGVKWDVDFLYTESIKKSIRPQEEPTGSIKVLSSTGDFSLC